MECWSIGNTKLQITNINQITMTEIQNSKQVYRTSFGHWKLDFGIWCLGFVILEIEKGQLSFMVKPLK